MLHEMTLFPKPYASIASGQKTIELVSTMKSDNRFKLVIRFDLPILKMLLSLHSVKWFSCMFLKALQNSTRTYRY